MLREIMTKPYNGEMTEGKHSVTLKNWEYKAHLTDPNKDYIALTFTHEKGEYKRNMFEKDITIMLSHLRRQLNRATETIKPQEFLNDLVTAKTPFDIWITYPIVPTANGTKRVQNLNFLEPYATIEPTAAEEEMEVPN